MSGCDTPSMLPEYPGVRSCAGLIDVIEIRAAWIVRCVHITSRLSPPPQFEHRLRNLRDKERHLSVAVNVDLSVFSRARIQRLCAPLLW
jgi:hypothetical protein